MSGVSTHDGRAERIANTISRDPEQGVWPLEAEAQRLTVLEQREREQALLVDLYRDTEVVVEQIDTTDLETTTCSTCGVGVVELDGIWYHAEAPGPIPEHIARPSKLTNGG